jgi:hypothetical protein
MNINNKNCSRHYIIGQKVENIKMGKKEKKLNVQINTKSKQ